MKIEKGLQVQAVKTLWRLKATLFMLIPGTV
jgi:hypothetical protein